MRVVCLYSDSVCPHCPGESSNNILHFKTVRAQTQQVLHPQKQVEAHTRYWQIRKSKPIVLHSPLCFLRVVQGATRVKHDVLSWSCQTNRSHVGDGRTTSCQCRLLRFPRWAQGFTSKFYSRTRCVCRNARKDKARTVSAVVRRGDIAGHRRIVAILKFLHREPAMQSSPTWNIKNMWMVWESETHQHKFSFRTIEMGKIMLHVVYLTFSSKTNKIPREQWQP